MSIIEEWKCLSFLPKINSFAMGNVIKAVEKIINEDTLMNVKQIIDTEIIGMRPGEKFHEDMLCKTEVEFTMQPSDELLCVLPQYTNKKHTYEKKYNGLEFNSSLHNNDNVDATTTTTTIDSNDTNDTTNSNKC